MLIGSCHEFVKLSPEIEKQSAQVLDVCIINSTDNDVIIMKDPFQIVQIGRNNSPVSDICGV